MGRKRKIKKADWADFLSRLERGQTVKAACEALGIDRSTPYRKRDRDEVFAREWDLAERVNIEVLSDSVVKAVLQPEVVRKYDSGGNLVEEIVKPPSIYNAIRVLERRHPHWKPSVSMTDDDSRVNLGSATIVDGRLCFGGNSQDG